ncbi:MAG: alpha/beta fold hydrolase [Lachnospiraceae bacterium]|nr:alpha/beta fold hydrolase [Lachnospiraceae bacterium]
MVKHEEFTFDSRDMKTKIHAEKYVPKGEVKACLIVAHGMGEHFGCYFELGRFFAEQGVLVAGCDHLGHGKTAKEESDFGYFCDMDPATVIVRDIHRLKKMIQADYPAVPFFVMGHSMGSFIIRNYIEMYGTGIKGAILMGTGDMNELKLLAGKTLLDILISIKGGHYISRAVTKAGLGGYSKNPCSEEYPFKWGCSRKESQDRKAADPLCGHEFTINGYRTIMELVERGNAAARMKDIPKNLPIFLVSGAEDPVGGYGKLVNKVAKRYKSIGMQDVTVKIYPDDRHEVYNEADRFDAFLDILHYMDRVMAGG